MTLVVTAMVFSVSAEGTANVSLSSVKADKGETVTVNVNLSDNPGLIGMGIDVGYDTSKLKLVSAKDGGVLNGYGSSGDYSGNSYTLYWSDALATTNNTSNGTIATLTFEVIDDIDSASSITVSASDAINKDVEDVSVSCSGGSVSPKTSSTTTTTKAPNATTTTKKSTTTTKKSETTTKKSSSTTTRRATTTYRDDYGMDTVTEYSEMSTDYWWMTEESSTEPVTESETETTTEPEEQKGTLSKTKTVLVVMMVCFAIIGVAIIVSIVKKSKN